MIGDSGADWSQFNHLALDKQTNFPKNLESLFYQVRKNRALIKRSKSHDELRKFDQVIESFFNNEFHLQNDRILAVHREKLLKLTRRYDTLCGQLESINNQNSKVRNSKDRRADSFVSLEEEIRDKVKINKKLNETSINFKSTRQSPERKIKYLDERFKYDTQELYLNLILFEQLIQFNSNNLERLLRLHDRMLESNLGRKLHEKWYRQRCDDLYDRLEGIERLSQNVARIYSSSFMSVKDDKVGDDKDERYESELRNSLTRRRTLSANWLYLRMGFGFGCLVLLLILLIDMLAKCTFDATDWPSTIRLFRGPLVIALFLLQASVSLIIWQHHNINYEYIFHISNDRLDLPYQHLLEYSLWLSIILSLGLMLWLTDEPTRYYSRHLSPLAVVMLMSAYLLNPTNTCHRRERVWLLKTLGRIATAPLHPVQFGDYWIADQFVSLVPLFLDLEYVACYYATTGSISTDDASIVTSDQCVSRDYPHLLIRAIVSVAPAWLRLCQCVRISRDQHWKPHQLFNALKYGSMIYVISLTTVAKVGDVSEPLADTSKLVWIVSSAIVSCVAAGWDMIYDFGVLESWYSVEREDRSALAKKPDDKRLPLLRRHLTYPVWFYYFAIIEDWILKFGWLIFVLMTRRLAVDAEVAITLTTMSDLFSKFIWNVIKVENEWRLEMSRNEATEPHNNDLTFSIITI